MEEDLSKFLDLQSPFRWRPIVRKENLNEFDYENEDSGTFSFLNFCTRIVLVYNEYVNNGKTSGDKLLKEVEEQLHKLENSNQDELYLKTKDALNHVFNSCKTLMAIFGGKHIDEVGQWIEKVKKFNEMDASNKAAIFAIKAYAHSLFSNDGLDTSFTLINMALSHDKETPYWSFLKGTILQKLRPTNEVPSLQEREAFDEAHKKDSSNPLFMVYLADCRRESCKDRPNTYLWFVAKSAQVNVQNTIAEKNEATFELYRKSYELKPNCPVVAFKCAKGLMRMPQKFQDVKLIKKIISDCEKKFPNSGFGNLVFAMYHERINKKIALSQRCLQKCVDMNIFDGNMNLIRIDFAEKKEDANVVERLEKMLEIFCEANRQEIIISQIISYYVFIEKNIEKACDYMIKYYRKKSNGRYLEKHQSCFKQTSGPVSLVDVITDQVKIKLKNRQLPKEKRQFFNDFVRQMGFHNVDVLKGNPKNLLEQIEKAAVPKGNNPKKTYSNEAKRNSSAHPNRQSNDRSRFAPRNGDPIDRGDVPSDRRGAGRSASTENVPQKNASPRRRDDRHSENRRFDHRSASFDKRPDRKFAGKENAPENSTFGKPDDRRLEDRRVENAVPHFDKRTDRGFGVSNASAKSAPKVDSAARKNDNRHPEEASASMQSASSEHAVAKKTVVESESQMLMRFIREGDGVDFDAVFENWKKSMKEKSKDSSKIPHTVAEEYDRQQVDRSSEVVEKVPSKGTSRRSEDRGARCDRSRSESSDRSHRHKHRRHRKPKSDTSELDDVPASKERSRRSKDRHRDRSQSASDHSRRRHRKAKSEVNELDDVPAPKERSRRSEDRHRDRSGSVSDHSRRRHRHPKHKHRHSSVSEDERRSRRSESPSRRHRRHSKEKRSRKHRPSKSPSDVDGSLDRMSRKSHRKHRHRKSKSRSNSSRSVDRDSRKSHRKHRDVGESVSESERSVDRHVRKSHRKHRSDSSESKKHRSKKHSSSERHRDKHKSHRHHEKSEKSRRKKESKKDRSDSESDGSH